MKHFTTAMLTLALITGLSADKASAQQANQVPDLVLTMMQTAESGMDDITGMLQWTDSLSNDGGYSYLVVPAHLDLIANHDGIIYFLNDGSADYPSPVDPYGCPSPGGQECEDLVDLWFELVDAGYTEDEAFEMIEMVIGQDIAEPLPERLPVKSYEDMVNY